MKRKVAIYARVSTEHEAQINALENQIQYYDNVMAAHPDWELVERYIDEGITGTSVKKRKNFMRMMDDALKGKFSLIITREVSRFARNTVDTLQQTRILKRNGVEVYFTEDNIWTMDDEDGELRLTLMATLAQNESKKTSVRVKAGQMISFENGVFYGNGNILGYDRVGKKMVVNPEQALTVKTIYKLYIDGYGLNPICLELEKLGFKTAMGKLKWDRTSVMRILKNPFYCGMIVYRKQYVPDYLEQKKINNHGAVDKIAIEGTHEPIISKEDFDKVQKLIDRRRIVVRDKNVGHKPSECIYARIIICSCGGHFNRKKWHKTKEGLIQYGYCCYKQLHQGSVTKREKMGLDTEGLCKVKMFPEWKLLMMAEYIFKELLPDKKLVVKRAEELLQEHINDNNKVDQTKELNLLQSQLDRIKNKKNNLLDLRIEGDISKEDYDIKKEQFDNKIDKLQSEIDAIRGSESEEELDPAKRIEELKKFIAKKVKTKKGQIPEKVIEEFVEKIVVHEDHFEWFLKVEKCDKINLSVTGRKNDSPKVDCSYKQSPTGGTQRRLQSPISN